MAARSLYVIAPAGKTCKTEAGVTVTDSAPVKTTLTPYTMRRLAQGDLHETNAPAKAVPAKPLTKKQLADRAAAEAAAAAADETAAANAPA